MPSCRRCRAAITGGPGGCEGAVRAADSRPYERIDGGDAWIAGLIWRGVGTPPYVSGRTHAVGAAFMAARASPRFPPHHRRTSSGGMLAAVKKPPTFRGRRSNRDNTRRSAAGAVVFRDRFQLGLRRFLTASDMGWMSPALVRATLVNMGRRAHRPARRRG